MRLSLASLGIICDKKHWLRMVGENPVSLTFLLRKHMFYLEAPLPSSGVIYPELHRGLEENHNTGTTRLS